MGEAQWRKASACNGGDCVEVSQGSRETVRVRDSKNPVGPVLDFTREEWVAFLDGARRGEFDLPV
jgi:hypothetical protein